MSEPTKTNRLIGTRAEFHAALREAIAETARTGSRELWMSDEDFADWPLDDAGVLADLSAWAKPHRRLTVLARHFDAIARRHPRWVEFRRHWAHVVECRAFEEAEVGEIPTLLLAPGVVVVRLFDPVRVRGSLSHDPGDLVRLRELVDVVSQRSVSSFPASILGL